MGRAAVLKIGTGSVLLAASCLQMAIPARVLQPPQERYLGLAVLPVSVLGLSTALFGVGVIVASEGICGAFGGTSLGTIAARDPLTLLRLLGGGAVAGLVLELIAQWLSRLWYYQYWTPWFYTVMLVPGFTFYWLAIVESYLAAKAVLDAIARPRPFSGSVRLWPVGAAAIAVALVLSIRWYARRGFAFDVTGLTPTAPPFGYALLAVAGVALLSGALVTAAVRRYWVPFAAMGLASVVVSLLMEIPNAVHWQWAYAHFPGPVAPNGLPLSVILAWPLHYVVFLAVPSAILPGVAAVFWQPPAAR